MQETPKFGLPVPEADDRYDIAVYAQALALLDSLAPRCSGLTHIQALARSAYDALEAPLEGTLYIVLEEGSFSLYLGELALKAGGGSPLATNFVTVHTASLTGAVGQLEEVNK